MNVDTLQVEIEASSNQAAEGVKKTTEAVKELKSATDQKFKNPIADIANASEVDLLQAKLVSLRQSMEDAISGGKGAKAADFRMKIIQTERALARAKAAADKASNSNKTLASSMKEAGTAAKATHKPLSNFVSSLQRIAFYRVVRSIVKAIGDAMAEGMKNAYLFSRELTADGDRFANAMDAMTSKTSKMKSEIGAAFLGLLTAIEPYIVSLINLLTVAANAINQFFAAITGGTYLKANDVTEQFAKNTAKGAKAAKEWKNQLLGFDEINRLNEPSSGGGGGGAGELLPSDRFSATPLDDWAQKIRDNLAAIELAAGVFELGLGLILLFSGANIPLGLGLIVAGGLKVWQSMQEDWSNVSTKVKQTLSDIMLAVGGALLAIGVILLLATPSFSWLGLGLVIAGLSTVAGGVAMNWDSIRSKLSSTLRAITMVVSGALLAVGALLTFTTANIPLGIGLMIAGAAGLAVAANINWDWVAQKVRLVVSGILAVLAGAMAVVGIILCFGIATLPIGVALLFAAYKTSHAAASIDENALTKKVRDLCDGVWRVVGGLFSAIHDGIQNILHGFSFINSRANKRAQSIWDDGSLWLEGLADGGIVSSGQLFVAREAGPELVGTIGGQTAVANNDQIISGIRQGVFEAVSAAMSGQGGGETIVKVYLDSREIKTGQQRLARAMG